MGMQQVKNEWQIDLLSIEIRIGLLMEKGVSFVFCASIGACVHARIRGESFAGMYMPLKVHMNLIGKLLIRTADFNLAACATSTSTIPFAIGG